MREIITLMEGRYRQPITGDEQIINTLVPRLQASNPRQIWSIIDAIGWGTITTDYDSIKLALSKVYNKRKIESIGNRVRKIRKHLASSITDYEAKNQIENLFNEGDDGFWDVTAHIVGLGKDAYNRAMKDPSQFVGGDYEENFEYSFQID